MQNEHIEIELPAAMVVGQKERRCAVQIDYLLLAIILFPLIAGSLLAYVARKNREGGAVQLSGEELQSNIDNIYDYRYPFRDIWNHDD